MRLKKWIYANLILKPEELLLFRPVKSGGLGLVSIKQKSTAFLIRTFMEVAGNPEYQTSQYLNSLYQFYILEQDFSCPSLPQYYSASFFNTIREAKNEYCKDVYPAVVSLPYGQGNFQENYVRWLTGE